MSAGLQELLLPHEVAAIFRVTKRTLWNWEHKGVLVPIRLPTGQKRYRKEDVEALLGLTRLEKGSGRSVIKIIGDGDR